MILSFLKPVIDQQNFRMAYASHMPEKGDNGGVASVIPHFSQCEALCPLKNNLLPKKVPINKIMLKKEKNNSLIIY